MRGLLPLKVQRYSSFLLLKIRQLAPMEVALCYAPSCQAGTYSNEIINQSVRITCSHYSGGLPARPCHALKEINLALTNMVFCVEWLPCSCFLLLIKSLAFYSILNSLSACWFGCLLIQELLNQAKTSLKFTQHFLPQISFFVALASLG